MDEEIKNILVKTKDGDKVLQYIEELEEHIKHHHHDDDCDCGCHDHDEEDEWEEIKTPYNNTLTVKDWEKLLKDETVFTHDSLIVMKRMRHIAAPTSSMELADTFGCGAVYYRQEIEKLINRLIEKLNIKDYGLALVLDGWKHKKSEEEIYALKRELYEALGNVDLSTIPLRESEI